jgi:hypothetical protein
MKHEPEWLTAKRAAEHLCFESVAAFYQWVRRNPVPVGRRGRTLLFDKHVLDAFVRGNFSRTPRRVS